MLLIQQMCAQPQLRSVNGQALLLQQQLAAEVLSLVKDSKSALIISVKIAFKSFNSCLTLRSTYLCALSPLLWDEQLFLHQFSGLFWYPQQTGQDDLCCFTSPTHSAFTFAKESGGNHGEKEEENVCVCQTPPDQQCPKGWHWMPVVLFWFRCSFVQHSWGGT